MTVPLAVMTSIRGRSGWKRSADHGAGAGGGGGVTERLRPAPSEYLAIAGDEPVARRRQLHGLEYVCEAAALKLPKPE